MNNSLILLNKYSPEMITSDKHSFLHASRTDIHSSELNMITKYCIRDNGTNNVAYSSDATPNR